MRLSRKLAARTLIAPLLLASILAPASALAAKQTLTFSGSTSIFPLATALAREYVKEKPGTIGFRFVQGGSDVGVNDVAHGRVSLGMASRDPLSSDPTGLTFYKIARDGICVITHPNNHLGNLSKQTVQAIFSGQIHDWSQVPGAGVSGAIDLITRTASSGTADAFRAIFLDNTLNISSSAAAKQSNGLVQNAVRSDTNAIGFVSFDFTAGTNTVGYQGVPCTLRNAKSGSYQGVRNFWLVSRGSASGAAKTFINFAQKSAKAKAIVATHWINLH